MPVELVDARSVETPESQVRARSEAAGHIPDFRTECRNGGKVEMIPVVMGEKKPVYGRHIRGLHHSRAGKGPCREGDGGGVQAEDRIGQNVQAVQPEEKRGVPIPLQGVPVSGERGRIDLAYGKGRCRDSAGFFREQEVSPQSDGTAFAGAHGSGHQIDESAVPEMRGGGEAPDILLIRKGAEFLLMQEKSRAARAKSGEPGSGAERFQQGSSVHDFHSVFWMAVTMQPPALMRKCGIFRQAGKKRGHRLFPKYFLPMPGRDFPGGILLSRAVCLKMEAKTGGKTMKGTGFAAQSLQELVARIRRQIAGDKKSGYLAEKPFKKDLAERYRARSEGSSRGSTGEEGRD